MNLGKAAARGALWSATASVAAQALSLLVFIIIARLIEPNAYGLIALSMALILIFNAISGLGLTKLLVQLKTLGDCETDTAFYLSAALGLLLAVCIWLSAPIIADLFATPELTGVLRWIVPIVLLKSLEVVPRGIMTRQFRFKALAIRSVLAIIAGGGVGVMMALDGYGVWALVAQELTKALISLLAIGLLSGWQPGTSVSIQTARKMLRTSLQILGMELALIAKLHLDRLLIGGFLGATTLGIYTIAAKVNLVATNLTLDPLASVGLPTFSRARSDPERLKQAYYLSQRLATAFTLPLFVVLILTADSVIPLVLGQQWQASVPIFKALLLASCAFSVGVFNSALLLSIGRAEIVFRLSLLNVATTILAFFVALNWGIVAIALTFAMRAWLVLPIEFALCRRYASIPIQPIWSGLTRQVLALTSMAIAIIVYQSLDIIWLPWPKLLFTLFLGLTSYILTLTLLDRTLANTIMKIPSMVLGEYK